MFVDPQHRLPRENQGALDHILQFTDIARPAVPHQSLKRFLIDVLARTIKLHGVLFQEMSSQEGDILRSIPEWRDTERKDIQTIKEIGSKCPVLDGGW